MFPPPPFDASGSPHAPGPAGLEAGVAKLFGPPTPPTAAPLDPYANLDRAALLKRFEEAKKDGQDLRWVFERQWWRNLLYVVGRQWIFFDVKRNEWRDKRLKKWIPKPVTNKMREVQASIRSMFAAVNLGVICRPNGNDPKNIATANTADSLQPLIHDEHQMDAAMRLVDFWTVVCGNAFLHPWWDKDGGPVQAVMHDACIACGETVAPAQLDNPGQFVCPTCGGLESEPTKVGDAPVGQGCTDVCSPLEIMLPSHAAVMADCAWVIRIRWRPKTYYETHYPELVTGPGALTFEKQPSERSLHLFKALAAQNDLSTTPFSWGSSQRAQAEGLTEYEYWERPSAAWPRGLFFRVLGDAAPRILEDPDQSSPGPIPVTTKDDAPLWPWIHVAYEPFGGRLWASGALDPLFQKQDQLNQLDSLVALHVQRNANSGWMIAKGTGHTQLTGEPGLIFEYDVVGTNNIGKPERFQGMPIDASLFEYRAQLLKDIDDLSGAYDVLKGAKPTGIQAFSALQLLVERSQSRFTNAFALRGEAYQAWFHIALELERAYGPTQRTLSLLGPNGTWTFQTFQHADLLGDVAIVVEDGTNVPKTALGKRAAMEQAHNMGFVDPLDPDQKAAFLADMGLTSLMPSLDAAKKAALRQQDAFEQWVAHGLPGAQAVPDPMTGQPLVMGSPLKIQPWDDPFILQNECRKWASSDHMQAILTDPQTGPTVTAILTAYWSQLALLTAPPPAPIGPDGPPAPNAAGPPQPGSTPGHTPGGGQAMPRSNGNSHPQAPQNHGNTPSPKPAPGVM